MNTFVHIKDVQFHWSLITVSDMFLKLWSSGIAFHWQFSISLVVITKSRNTLSHSNWAQVWEELRLMSLRTYGWHPGTFSFSIHTTFPRPTDQASFLFVLEGIQEWVKPPAALRAKTTNHVKIEQVSDYMDNAPYLTPLELIHWFDPSGLSSQGFSFNEALNKYYPEGNKWITHWKKALRYDLIYRLPN